MTANDVTVEVGTPKGLFTGIFAKTAKIKEVIAAAIESLGLDGGDSLELVHNGEVLHPVERTLVSFGFIGTVGLELVATGNAV